MLLAELRLSEAREAFERCVALQPVQTEGFYELGEIARMEGRAAEAAALYERVLTRNPAHAGALTGLGQMALMQKNYAQALQYFSRAVAASGSFVPAHRLYAVALARTGKRKQSAEQVEIADRITAEQTQAQTGRRLAESPFSRSLSIGS